ncbi:MAG: PD-(D/E)XK nuclease family protein, partial [Planctomycetes bacterium]|nr:PD-(D/E)XK nuclease family protein [Planctomycetota bacterium]
RLPGVEGLLAIDYKTGALPTKNAIDEGRNLQGPIYAAAAEQIFGSRVLGAAFHRIAPPPGRPRELYFAAIRKRSGNFKIDESYEERREAAAATIGRFVRSIRMGRFDVLPSRNCPSYCPYRRICHYQEARAGLKSSGAEQEGGP